MSANLDPGEIPKGEGIQPAPQQEAEQTVFQAPDESTRQQNFNSEALEEGDHVGKSAYVPQNVNIALISYVLCHIVILVLFGVIMSATLESIHELMIVHKICARRPKVEAIEYFLNLLNASNYFAFFATGFALHNCMIGIDLLCKICVTNVQYIISSALKCNLFLSGTAFFIAITVAIFTYHSNEEAIEFINSLECIGVIVEQRSLHIINTETQPQPDKVKRVKSSTNIGFTAMIQKIWALFMQLSIMVRLCLILCLVLGIFFIIRKLKRRDDKTKLSLEVKVTSSTSSSEENGSSSTSLL